MVRPCGARGFVDLIEAVLHYCVRPLIGASAPGHHGYQRACDLILGQASNGLVGSPVFARAGKTDQSIVVSSSRRPRRVAPPRLRRVAARLPLLCNTPRAYFLVNVPVGVSQHPLPSMTLSPALWTLPMPCPF